MCAAWGRAGSHSGCMRQTARGNATGGAAARAGTHLEHAVEDAARLAAEPVDEWPDDRREDRAAPKARQEQVADALLGQVVRGVERVHVRALHPIGQHDRRVHHRPSSLERRELSLTPHSRSPLCGRRDRRRWRRRLGPRLHEKERAINNGEQREEHDRPRGTRQLLLQPVRQLLADQHHAREPDLLMHHESCAVERNGGGHQKVRPAAAAAPLHLLFVKASLETEVRTRLRARQTTMLWTQKLLSVVKCSDQPIRQSAVPVISGVNCQVGCACLYSINFQYLTDSVSVEVGRAYCITVAQTR